ncbi:hypothetical protein [uncultured Jannaschia sp.]|uniref:hypothetical protein n=1 Tax=uncultured Jannaschia sp. TaxID=293347 RepID=UPI002609A0A0|nr:hypothetical protein [uncultured Jannaschia sp.]
MLNLRSAKLKPKPKPEALADAVTNPEKARALLALLEAGDTSKVPPERLRDWASDLVRTVERQKADAMARKTGAPVPRPVAAEAAPPREPVASVAAAPATPAAAPKVSPAARPDPTLPQRSRLFRSSAPKLAPKAETEVPRRAAPAKPDVPVRPVMAAPATASHLPHAMTPAPFRSQRHAVAVRSLPTRAEIRVMVTTAVTPATLSDEHPAVIAMTLFGKPSLEQAEALRGLPGGQARAVHRALRQLAAGPK